MHDQATLVKGSGRVGAPGTEVTIEAVEAVYTSSSAANAAETFCCAGCGVSVIAVITDQTKIGRKKSPTSYFRATPVSHKPSCRPPTAVSKPTTASRPGTKPASPTKASLPTAWDDSPDTTTGPATKGGAGSTSGAGPGARSGTSMSGAGTSRSKSKRVERFAAEWKTMPPATRAATELLAGWNAGGTYDSAFFDLSAFLLAGASPTRTAIYRGTIANVRKGTSGYILTLVEKHKDGRELRVWVQNFVSTSGPAGVRLWNRLTAGSVLPGAEVFALGEFLINHRPTVAWYSLPITTGNHVWVP
ncbi:hypothetical protein DES44_1202 [Roseateles depolymerans]|uniref:Uncharacterized protein n=1 Tax=Roseateles depolymerans TaxID=76731 RepID=A0A0U3N0L3_9BURK|nr:hypothetical protein RD2015_3258 [Roseateles depolymerans]REG22060.1 hypothetical protein DES44_1202 [Roseateles depolymerans]